jgi:hypothetical protein
MALRNAAKSRTDEAGEAEDAGKERDNQRRRKEKRFSRLKHVTASHRNFHKTTLLIFTSACSDRLRSFLPPT